MTEKQQSGRLTDLSPEDLARVRKQFGIPEDADLTLLEMEHFFPFEMWGWDDEQLKDTTPDKIQALIDQRRLGLAKLEEAVDNERREVLKLEVILERCKVLHGD